MYWGCHIGKYGLSNPPEKGIDFYYASITVFIAVLQFSRAFNNPVVAFILITCDWFCSQTSSKGAIYITQASRNKLIGIRIKVIFYVNLIAVTDLCSDKRIFHAFYCPPLTLSMFVCGKKTIV